MVRCSEPRSAHYMYVCSLLEISLDALHRKRLADADTVELRHLERRLEAERGGLSKKELAQLRQRHTEVRQCGQLRLRSCSMLRLCGCCHQQEAAVLPWPASAR